MTELSANGSLPAVQCFGFAALIGIGMVSIIVTSSGIANHKTKNGKSYYLQVLALIGAIVWTLLFTYKLIGKQTSDKLKAAWNARMGAKAMAGAGITPGGTTNLH
jgi:hypothetical protein